MKMTLLKEFRIKQYLLRTFKSNIYKDTMIVEFLKSIPPMYKYVDVIRQERCQKTNDTVYHVKFERLIEENQYLLF